MNETKLCLTIPELKLLALILMRVSNGDKCPLLNDEDRVVFKSLRSEVENELELEVSRNGH